MKTQRKRVENALRHDGYEGEFTPQDVVEFIEDSGKQYVLDGKTLDEKAIRAIFKVTTDDATGDIVNISPMEGEADPNADQPAPASEEMKAIRDELAALKATVNKSSRTGKSPVPGQTTRGLSSGESRFSGAQKAYANKIARFGIGGRREQAAFADGETAAKFGAWARLSIMGQRGYAAKSDDLDILGQKANTIGSFTAGGAVVPDEFRPELIRLVEEYGVARRLVGTMPMTRDVMTVPRRTGGLTVYMPGEATAITESNPALDNVNLVAQEWFTLTRVSMALLESSAIDFGDLIAKEVALAFANKEDDIFFNGTGATATYFGNVGVIPKMTGLGANPEDAAGLQLAAGDVWSEITLENIEAMLGKAPSYVFNGSPTFVCNSKFFFTVLVRLMHESNTASAVVAATSKDRSAASPMQFLGFPVVFSQVMQINATGTSARDTVPLLFGAFDQAAKIGEVTGGVSIDTSEHRYFDSAEIAFRARERIAINVHDVGTDSTTNVAGPVVGLIMEDA